MLAPWAACGRAASRSWGVATARLMHEWASASSCEMRSHVAVRDCIDQLMDQLDGGSPRLVTAFFGTEHLKEGPLIAREVYKRTGTEVSTVLDC